MKQKVLITGASGFVGKNLKLFLQENGFETQTLSLRNADWKVGEDVSVIIHLAGKAHDTNNTIHAKEYFQVNTELTKKLFDVFVQSKSLVSFLFFSSVKAVADRVEDMLTETMPENPETPYGKSKFQAEEYLQSKTLASDKKVYILRPCMIHGVGNKGNLNSLYGFVKKGIPYPFSRFNNERSFLSIDNLNFLIKSILENNTPSGIYNVADDEFVSTNQLISIISTTIGRKPRFLKVPKKLIYFSAKIGDRLRLPFNSEKLQKLTENYRVSNAKIKHALSIERLPFTAEQGLIKTIQSFKGEK